MRPAYRHLGLTLRMLPILLEEGQKVPEVWQAPLPHSLPRRLPPAVEIPLSAEKADSPEVLVLFEAA